MEYMKGSDPLPFASSPVIEAWPEGKAYRFTCSFYSIQPVKAGNFTDATTSDGLGVHTVYTASTKADEIAEAAEKLTGYSGMRILKRISAEKRGSPGEEVAVDFGNAGIE